MRRTANGADTKPQQTGEILGAPKNLTHMAYRHIKEMMLTYDLIPGQRLIFVDLAKRLGVSRTPVNNALGILANEGFLDFVPNQGYTVHKITPEEANDLYELREIVELGALDRAIRALTREKLDVLRSKKILYERSVIENINRGRFTLDQEFHAAYIEMAENPYLTEYFREIYQRIFLRHPVEGLHPGRAKQVVLEHNEIFNAIRLKDVRKARHLIKQHIWTGKEYIFSAIRG